MRRSETNGGRPTPGGQGGSTVQRALGSVHRGGAVQCDAVRPAQVSPLPLLPAKAQSPRLPSLLSQPCSASSISPLLQPHRSTAGSSPALVRSTREAVLEDADALLACYGVGEESGARLTHTVVELLFTTSIEWVSTGKEGLHSRCLEAGLTDRLACTLPTTRPALP